MVTMLRHTPASWCVAAAREITELLHGYVPKDKRCTNDGDQDPKKTEEALENSFPGLLITTSKDHGSNVISMCVVPVKVKHKHGANEVTTYTMLDNCIQGLFIHNSLFKKLGVTGRKTTINMKTLHGERSEKTISLEGIKVAQWQGNSSWLLKFTKDVCKKEFTCG